MDRDTEMEVLWRTGRRLPECIRTSRREDCLHAGL